MVVLAVAKDGSNNERGKTCARGEEKWYGEEMVGKICVVAGRDK